MSRTKIHVTSETEIRTRVDEWLNSVRNRDLDAIASFYAPDVRAFDAISQLEFRGRDVYKEHWAACFAICPGPMVFELDALEIEVDGDLAFSHALTRCGGAGPDGEVKTSWMRATACYRKTNGRWEIAHEHFSVPFDMKTGAPLFELQP